MDREGKSVMSSIAMRRIIRGGQTYKAFIDDYPDVRKTAEEAALRLGGKGPLNVQGRLSGDHLKIFEINPRFSASCPMRAVAKINEPDIIFRNAVLGEDIKAGSYERLVCFRYWNEVYVPYSTYDRTVIEKEVKNGDSFILDYF
jgi:carbamoyl-phosphate synthase large subunit